MRMSRVVISSLILAGAIPFSASASEPTAPSMAAAVEPSPAATLDEEYFQRAVRDYQKYQHDGQIVYCKKERPIGSSVPAVQCVTESALRARIENARRSRNAVAPYTG